MTIPTLDLSLAPPGKMRMLSPAGGGIEGGRSLSGVDGVIDMTGGGILTLRYSDIELGNVDPRRQLYWSRLAAILNPRVRSIIVPVITDFIMPGAFSATLAAAAALNAGTLQISLTGVFVVDHMPLVGGEWFELVHPTRLNRAYCITDIDAATVNTDGTASFTVGISPPLREAATSGQALNFNRPKCLMRLAPGAQITSDVDSAFWTTPDIDFVESWGTI